MANDLNPIPVFPEDRIDMVTGETTEDYKKIEKSMKEKFNMISVQMNLFFKHAKYYMCPFPAKD